MSTRRIDQFGIAKLVGLATPLLLLLASCANTWAQDGPQVQVQQGTLQGRDMGGGLSSFLGIPFAAPPVGNLRWRLPEPPLKWSGLHDAAKPSASCTQPRSGGSGELLPTSSEDCLYLNIWTPSVQAGANLPVMLWIHGGGFVDGTGANPVFYGKTLAARGVILVTINYRLGVFGFFAHPALAHESPHHAAGNYGLADQLAALRWVHENIKSFGGDPRQVTIFGQSAGAGSVTDLMASPQSSGLFRAAIAESGTPLLGAPFIDLAVAERQGTDFAQAAGATSIADLRKMPVEQVFNQWKDFNAGKMAHLGVIVDGWILPRAPAQVFASHSEMRIPLLIGSNAREALGPVTEDVMGRLQTAYGDAAPRAAAIYLPPGDTPPADPILGTTGNMLDTDLTFRCPAVAIERWHALQGSPVFAYQFEAGSPYAEKLGAQHSAELMYVFGYANVKNPAGTQLSHTMVSYWTNFAKHMDPNGTGLPTWPRFGVVSADFMHLGKSGAQPDQNLRAPACALYRDAVVPSLLSQNKPLKPSANLKQSQANPGEKPQ